VLGYDQIEGEADPAPSTRVMPSPPLPRLASACPLRLWRGLKARIEFRSLVAPNDLTDSALAPEQVEARTRAEPLDAQKNSSGFRLCSRTGADDDFADVAAQPLRIPSARQEAQLGVVSCALAQADKEFAFEVGGRNEARPRVDGLAELEPNEGDAAVREAPGRDDSELRPASSATRRSTTAPGATRAKARRR
jgi:hypothetical protein